LCHKIAKSLFFLLFLAMALGQDGQKNQEVSLSRDTAVLTLLTIFEELQTVVIPASE